MTKLKAISIAKTFRQKLDEILQDMKAHREVITHFNLETEFEDVSEVIAQHILSIRDLESTIMRQGLALKSIGSPDPYPESRNPESPVVAPTSDGLKL